MKNWLKHFFIAHEGNDYKPHFFREEAFQAVLGVLFLLFFMSAAGSFVVRSTSMLGSVYSSLLVDLTNKDRSEAGYPELTVNPLLEQAAQLKADDMVEKSYFAHTSPEGVTPWFWFKQAGYNFRYAGENLAVGFEDSTDVNEGWLNSPSHKANIVNSHFTEIGIATKEGMYNGKKTTFVVQLFGSPEVIAPEPKPVLVQAPEEPTSTITETQPVSVPGVVASANSAPVTAPETPVPATEPEPSPLRTIVETPEFALVENGNTPENPAFRSDLNPAPTYATGFSTFVLKENHAVQYIFLAVMLLIFGCLSVYLFIEFKAAHVRHVTYGILMLVLTISLALLNHQYFLIT